MEGEEGFFIADRGKFSKDQKNGRGMSSRVLKAAVELFGDASWSFDVQKRFFPTC